MEGYIVQVLDFAMNFSNRYQDEVQSAYWTETQTTIHGTVNFYKCLQDSCNEVVSLALVHVSADLKHDGFLARAAMNMTFAYLVEVGVPLELVIQFCDNCSAQYKSRRPFVEISRCALNLIRVFFGEKHGKSHADALFGRLKAWMSYKIKVHHFIVKNAYDFYKFCREFYETPILQGHYCQHYRVHFEFIRPCDVRRHQDSDLDKAVEHTQKLYSVRNTNLPLQLRVRSVPCLCSACIHETGRCENYRHTDPWKLVELKPSKGANKNKYKKRPHPNRKVIDARREEMSGNKTGGEDATHQMSEIVTESGISYRSGDLSDEDGIEDDEITFEIAEDGPDVNNDSQNGQTDMTERSDSNSSGSKITNVNVTDAVTDSLTQNAGHTSTSTSITNCGARNVSWVNINEEIKAQDFMSCDSTSAEDGYEVEIIDLCQEASKEFQLSSENMVHSCETREDISLLFKQIIPHGVLWASVLTAMDECRDFNELIKLCTNLKDEMPQLKKRVKATFSRSDLIDTVAQSEIPPDGPRQLFAVETNGDGNCMPRAVSKGYFNTDEFHLELRARLVVEGVINRDSYLNDDCLERGATFLHHNADLPTVFTTFSEYYTPGQKITADSISCIYCLEIHSIARPATYMGLWQIAQASSVLGIPIHSIYPVRGKSQIRKDFNRMFFPLCYSAEQDDEPLVLMWTGLRSGSAPVHFVPLLPSDTQ